MPVTIIDDPHEPSYFSTTPGEIIRILPGAGLGNRTDTQPALTLTSSAGSQLVINYGRVEPRLIIEATADPGETRVINMDGGVIFGDDNTLAVKIERDNVSFYNRGSIGDSGTGVLSTGDDLYLNNTGTIYGGPVGISLRTGNAKIYNSGDIRGDTGIVTGFLFGTVIEDVHIVNRGDVSGTFDAGVSIEGDGSRIDNYGSIRGGDFTAVYVDNGNADDIIRINNFAGGLIKGEQSDTLSIFGSSAREFVLNDGVLDGNVELGAGRDYFRGAGVISYDDWEGAYGYVDGQDGNDRIEGSIHGEDFRGGAGSDLLKGFGGADILTGGAGDDFLFGGDGNDLLTGGQGSDRFIFEGQDPTEMDTITDFENDVDVLNLSFTNLLDTADALAHMSDVGANTLLMLDNGAVLIIDGINVADLADDILVS